ncbi:pyridoxamine 5'-phosphate oxidase [Saccharicrinis sp. GN24d3]|uniref:pyridoxamine 5'-phosphate oxidase n=1 Tax=Saccharicrinis sp. GN24d3 TaxID=3458416 RepID=UPI0040373D25
MKRDLSHIRSDYTRKKLLANQLDVDPINQIKAWLSEAIGKRELEPTAMTLSTVSGSGMPSSRMVLLKNIDKNGGLWFFTNYNSKKGSDLKENNNAAVNFFWPGLERQIRVTGVVEKISEVESEAYFNSRPFDSQVSAIASPQSRVVESREQLEHWFKEAKAQEIKRPVNWGGYALLPAEIEFWQGRPGRLHDRIRYRLIKDEWVRERLAP